MSPNVYQYYYYDVFFTLKKHKHAEINHTFKYVFTHLFSSET